MRKPLLTIALIAGLSALAGAEAATAVAVPMANQAKTCRAGWVSARIGGKHKCLHSREFCSKRYARQYPRYGFHCVNGRLR